MCAWLRGLEDRDAGSKGYCNHKRDWFPITQTRPGAERQRNRPGFSIFPWHMIGEIDH